MTCPVHMFYLHIKEKTLIKQTQCFQFKLTHFLCLVKMKFFSSILFFIFSVFSLTTAQNDPKCGTNGPVQSKIVGGEEATPYEYNTNNALPKIH